MKKVIVTDSSRCIGCESCILACSLYHEDKCSPSYSRISVLEFSPLEYKFVIGVCKQCNPAPCMNSCPVGAMKIEESTGAIIIIEEKCIGCGVCAQVCPFNEEKSVLKYNSQRKVYMKCDLCLGRNMPICVEVCPTGALKYVDWKPEFVSGGE